MMMTATIVLMLESCNAVVKSNFAGESTLREQLQSAVHRREADACILLPDQPVQFISGKVLASLQERAQNSVVLLGVLQAHVLKVPMQDFFGLSNHLARDRRLIVDTLLQHF